MLKQLQDKCAELGCVKGESAKDFAKRNPVASKQLAEWIKQNHIALVTAIAAKV